MKAMTVKTDRNDARGMAPLMRMGWFRCESACNFGPLEGVIGVQN